MKYPYRVFHNNVLYMPFEEVPDGKETPVETPVVAEQTKQTEKEYIGKQNLETATIDRQLGLLTEEKPKKAKKYGVNEIKRMTVARIKEVAIEYGLNPADYAHTTDLKIAVIEEVKKKG